LQGLPRGIRELCGKYEYKPNAKALELTTIRKIWTAASVRMKAWMALALNVGFYAADIADLKDKEIDGGYIIKERGKTGVPTKLKLWRVTQRLLGVTGGSDKSGYLYPGRQGKRLIHYNAKKTSRTDPIAKGFRRLCDDLDIKGYSFSNLRDTSSTLVESIDPALTDAFDGHKDKRMARFYVDPAMLDTSRLDAVIGRLEATYRLTLSEEEIRAWQEKKNRTKDKGKGKTKALVLPGT
jgi:hypothetical protein